MEPEPYQRTHVQLSCLEDMQKLAEHLDIMIHRFMSFLRYGFFLTRSLLLAFKRYEVKYCISELMTKCHVEKIKQNRGIKVYLET